MYSMGSTNVCSGIPANTNTSCISNVGELIMVFRRVGTLNSSGPADTCSAPMTAADQIVRSAKKVLAMEGRRMTTFAPILMSFSFRLVSD